jgi:hypothetical protein
MNKELYEPLYIGSPECASDLVEVWFLYQLLLLHGNLTDFQDFSSCHIFHKCYNTLQDYIKDAEFEQDI